MLTLTAPSSVRPIPAEATDSRHGRTPGAVGWLLDPEVIEAWLVSERVPSLEEPEFETKARLEPLLLLQSPSGQLAIIGSEGVGLKEADADSETIPAYIAIGWDYQRKDIPISVVQQAITGEGADVAGFIRLFGGRLDTNAFIWRQFVGID